MNFTPIKLTIVDFLGVFIPGTVWIVLFATLRDTIIVVTNSGSTFAKFPNPLNEGLYLLTLPDAQYGTKFYLGLALVAIILGYLNISVSTGFAESCANRILWIKSIFPYNTEFSDKPYLNYIYYHLYAHYIHSYSQQDLIQLGTIPENFLALKLPIYQPFETCKRFLKIHAPTLWEEAQYREAQVRLLSSLFLASMFNIFLAILNSFLIKVLANFIWLIISVIIIFYLATMFKHGRLREVQEVYLSTFVVLMEQNYNDSQKSK